MKQITLTLCALFFFNLLNAQILIQQVSQGVYNYDSQYQPSDLHFYLYGDGHHSFESDNQHEFGINANGNTVKSYHSEPYDVDQVDQLVLNTINDGITSATIPNYTFPNKVALKRSWNLVNTENNFYILMFENKESSQPISGCIEFHYRVDDANIAGSAILDNYANNWIDPNEDHSSSEFQIYTDKFVWDFENLAANEQRFIYIPANCLADPMDIVKTMAVMKVDDCKINIKLDRDGDGANPAITNSNYFTLRSQVKNFPHDPNGIVTDPNCIPIQGNVHTTRFTIYFQNEGIDAAEDVFLYFSINTPFKSIKLITASKKCEMNWNPLNENSIPQNVNFSFWNIFLAGLADDPAPDYDDTYGWVTFDVCFNLEVFSQLNILCANSNVDIVFDSEPPVSATNEICRQNDCGYDDTSVSHQFKYYPCPEVSPATQVTGPSNEISDIGTRADNMVDDFQVYPNPVNNLLYITTDADSNKIVKIRNTTGEIILEFFVKDLDQSIDLSDIPSGVYYISLQNEVSVKTKSFVKI